MIFSCNKEDDDTNKEDGKAKTEFNVNLDPTDYSIATIFSPDGDSIYVFITIEQPKLIRNIRV